MTGAATQDGDSLTAANLKNELKYNGVAYQTNRTFTGTFGAAALNGTGDTQSMSFSILAGIRKDVTKNDNNATTRIAIGIERFDVSFTYATVNVTYDPSGGILDGSYGGAVLVGTTIAELPTPTKGAAYVFAGWELSGLPFTAGASVVPDYDFTLVAQWVIRRFTVTFIVEGQVYYAIEVDYGAVFTASVG